MDKFVIQGGEPLSGEITVAGNKNAALPIIAASLLTEEEVVLSNVPRIRDTEAQVGLLESIGVRAAWSGGELRLRAEAISEMQVSEELAERIRASFLLAGPLLARFGEAHRPPRGRRSAGAASTRTSTPSATWGPGSPASVGSTSWRARTAFRPPTSSSE